MSALAYQCPCELDYEQKLGHLSGFLQSPDQWVLQRPPFEPIVVSKSHKELVEATLLNDAALVSLYA